MQTGEVLRREVFNLLDAAKGGRLKKLKEVNQYVEGNIFKSVENVNLEMVVAYKKDGVKHHFLDDYDTKASISQK